MVGARGNADAVAHEWTWPAAIYYDALIFGKAPVRIMSVSFKTARRVNAGADVNFMA